MIYSKAFGYFYALIRLIVTNKFFYFILIQILKGLNFAVIADTIFYPTKSAKIFEQLYHTYSSCENKINYPPNNNSKDCNEIQVICKIHIHQKFVRVCYINIILTDLLLYIMMITVASVYIIMITVASGG